MILLKKAIPILITHLFLFFCRLLTVRRNIHNKDIKELLEKANQNISILENKSKKLLDIINYYEQPFYIRLFSKKPFS